MLWLRCAVLFALMALSSASVAQTDKAAAEALFREGMRLSKGGNYAEACPKLEESQRLEASLGTQFYLADCFEKVGKTASAWANFVEVANKARVAGETAKEQTARKRADELEPKLAKLSVDVEDGKLPGMIVQRGAIAIGSGQWGLPLPIDPGTYELKASAPGHEDFTKSIEVKSGATVTEKIPALKAVPASAAPAAPLQAAAPIASSPPPPPEPPAVSSTQRTVGLVVGAAGLVTLATSGVLGLMAKSANSSSKEAGYCLADDTCTDQGLDERDRALKLADAATVVSIIGAVVTTTGVVLWLTAPSSHTETPASARLGVGPGSLVLRGQF
jgi:hypothetical protein